MTIESGTAHVTPADGNIFADLGFSPEKAEQLLAKSKERLEQKRKLKEGLMAEIVTEIGTRNLKQADAAVLLGVTRPRISDLQRKHTAKFSVDALVDMLAKVGKQLRFTVVG